MAAQEKNRSNRLSPRRNDKAERAVLLRSYRLFEDAGGIGSDVEVLVAEILTELQAINEDFNENEPVGDYQLDRLYRAAYTASEKLAELKDLVAEEIRKRRTK